MFGHLNPGGQSLHVARPDSPSECCQSLSYVMFGHLNPGGQSSQVARPDGPSVCCRPLLMWCLGIFTSCLPGQSVCMLSKPYLRGVWAFESRRTIFTSRSPGWSVFMLSAITHVVFGHFYKLLARTVRLYAVKAFLT